MTSVLDAKPDALYWPLILAAVVAVPELIGTTASLLQRSRIGSPLPKELQGIYDEEEYDTSMRYTKAKSSFSLLKNAFDVTVFFAFWFLGGFPWLDNLCTNLGYGDIATGMIFIASLSFASQIIDTPWGVYHTFVLEEQFGFNKTTPMTFVKDRIKGLVLGLAIGGPVLAIVLWFLSRFGTGAWFWVFCFISSFQMILLFLTPAVILPMFLEMIPLPNGTAMITSEKGSDDKTLPGFLSGRVFYAKEEVSDGKPCWVTLDRRFAGASAGATLSIAWSPSRNEWLISEGGVGENGRIYATSSEASLEDSPKWLITPEAYSEGSAEGGDARASTPLVSTTTESRAESFTAVSVDAGSLKTKLLSLADKLGYLGAKIFVIDGSARSAHSNAFCIGFGSLRRICLFDTLLPTLTEGEILAVLGHEIGHDRLYHVHTGLVIGIAYSFIMLFALGNFLNSPQLAAGFFCPAPKVYLSVVFFSTAWAAVDFVVEFVMSANSRSHEYAADRYSVEADETYGALLISGLKKMMKKSKVNLTPHPFYVALKYSHPPLDARILAIEEHHKKKYQ
eukprot:TRINITY_DN26192_c0_g1_i1.p1 TRINITY_DN26192_c0_g1~~TRINITY_DN26192_c0_g1_i1.p1  ORF type:complete len:581 (-),score=84.94 TRINITY_DN26192_c0_g1_i1:164-1852(-)